MLESKLDGLKRPRHGMKHTRFYKIFENIKSRCKNFNPNYFHYRYYAGKGIKCEWKNFLEFRDDMYESYLSHCQKESEKNTTIDRIDNSKNYCKENCRWATRAMQARNATSNIRVKINNIEKTTAEWAEEFGMKKSTVSVRIKNGIVKISKGRNEK